MTGGGDARQRQCLSHEKQGDATGSYSYHVRVQGRPAFVQEDVRVGHVVAAQLQDQHHDPENRVVAACGRSDDTGLEIMILIL